METVFRSSFFVGFNLFQTDLFPAGYRFVFACERMGLEHLGPVPGERGSLRIREAGALGGGTPPPVRAAAGPFGACGAKASAPGCVYQPTFVSGRPGPRFYRSPFFSCRRISVESRFRLFHLNEEGLLTTPLCLRAEWKNQKSFVCVS